MASLLFKQKTASAKVSRASARSGILHTDRFLIVIVKNLTETFLKSQGRSAPRGKKV
jgi:hypothetical protein